MQKVEENLRILSDNEIELVLSLGLLSSKQFYYTIQDKVTKEKVGQCGIRLLETEENEYLGNIEYELFAPYQGNHLAYKASMLLSSVALFFGIRKVSITTNATNLASIATIQKLGAHYVCVKKVPKKDKLYKTSHEVLYYEWNLEEKERKI